MRIWTIIFYFVFAIMFLASIGVILPLVFDNINKDSNLTKNLNQNIVTYFVAILVSASLDYVMRLIDDNVPYRKLAILGVCIVNTALLLLSTYILYKNSKSTIEGISVWAIGGVVVSYIMWWIANFKNSAFNINATLGGNAENPLKNR